MLQITNTGESFVVLKDLNDYTYILNPGEKAKVEIDTMSGRFSSIEILR